MAESLMSEESIVIIRSFNPSADNAFLYSSWRNGLWYAEKRDEKDAKQFFKDITKEISQKLESGVTKIACLENDPTQLIGYSHQIETCLVWVYVKLSYRNLGVAKLLTKGFETVEEPVTSVAKKLVEMKKLKVKNERSIHPAEELRGTASISPVL